MKISKKQDLQQIAINHLPDNDFKDFTNFYKNYAYIFFANILFFQLMILIVLDAIF